MRRWLPVVAWGAWSGSSLDGDGVDGRYVAIQWGRFQLELSFGRAPA